MQIFFKQALVSVKVFYMFILSWIKMDVERDWWLENWCRWRNFRNFIEDFSNIGQKVYIISEIISSNMKYEIDWLFLDYVI